MRELRTAVSVHSGLDGVRMRTPDDGYAPSMDEAFLAVDDLRVSTSAVLRGRVRPAVGDSRRYLTRYAFALANELGLTDEERRELAMMLPTRMNAHEPVSWAVLDVKELATMVHWLNGATRVYTVLSQRPPI